MLKRSLRVTGEETTHWFCHVEIQEIVDDEECVGGNCVVQALGLHIIKAC